MGHLIKSTFKVRSYGGGEMKYKLLQAGYEGLKKNLLPGLVLQSIALSIVLMYYFIPAVQNFFEVIGTIKNENSFLFSAVSTSLFGGLIPTLYMIFSKQIKKEHIAADLLFFILIWAWKGMEVDAFYRLQGLLFGTDPSVIVIVKKTFFDQFVYSVIWAAPSLAIVYMWRECNYSFGDFKKMLRWDFVTFRIPSLIISTWFFWIPAVSIIYCLPMALQIPMFNLVLCFWVLILNVISRHTHQKAGESAAQV